MIGCVRERADLTAPTPNGQAVVNGDQADADVTMKTEDAPTAGASVPDAALRSLRLNLLALAKRAPLDTIARLPKDLVPEHIRHFVPTLGSTEVGGHWAVHRLYRVGSCVVFGWGGAGALRREALCVELI